MDYQKLMVYECFFLSVLRFFKVFYNIVRNLETAGKAINVTETSALIEQLVRGDLMAEAVEITQSMLMKNMHPMPKIFRYANHKFSTFSQKIYYDRSTNSAAFCAIH
jgi:hypothetical protein